MAPAASPITQSPTPTSAAPTAPKTTPRQPINGLEQSNGASSVTIAAKWRGIQGASLIFDIAMDTHSGSLDQFDLGKLAALRDQDGKEYAPVSWRSQPGGHHREGVLAFPIPDLLSKGGAKPIGLVLRGITGVPERVLQWNF